MIAWYVYDEPNNDLAADSAGAIANYNAVKAVDSMRPAYVNWGMGCPSSSVINSDIASSDEYPVPAYSPSLVGVDASYFAATGKPGWIWLQAGGYAYWMTRAPTAPEAECMFYSALINGARGLLYWMNTPYCPELWGEMKQLAPEVKTLTPVLYSLETAPTVSSSTQGIELVGKTYNAQPYIIAVNDSPSSMNATLNISGSYASANVLFENRYVSVANGQLQDTFAGFQRHVYRALSAPSCTLNVIVTLENYSGDLSLLPIRVDLLQNGSVVYTATVTPTSNPATIAFTDIPAGNYSVRTKAAKYLSGVSSVALSASTYSSQNVSLVNGDVDGDNEVTTTDFSSMLKNLGLSDQ